MRALDGLSISGYRLTAGVETYFGLIFPVPLMAPSSRQPTGQCLEAPPDCGSSACEGHSLFFSPDGIGKLAESQAEIGNGTSRPGEMYRKRGDRRSDFNCTSERSNRVGVDVVS